jgi:hypothetical protein
LKRRAVVETKVVVVTPPQSFSTVVGKSMRITLPRLPWEPKEEVKEEA